MSNKLYRIQEASHDGATFDSIADPFIVPTPRAYVIDLAYYSTGKKKQAVIKKTLESVQLLYDILASLDISIVEAHRKNYTLNLSTKDKLLSLACSKNNMAAVEKINTRRW